MSEKSDRQDGDGLLPCLVCHSNKVEEFERQEGLFVVSCENDDCIFTVEAYGGSAQDARYNWNTRPPTRDGAEGAAREALKAARPHIGDWLDSLSRARLLEQVDAALSEPVPPADGIGVVVDQILHQFENDDRTLYPDYEVILAIEKIQSAIARSPAVAAEADPSLGLPKSRFAKYKTGAEIDAENASHPVRGDRAILDQIATKAREWAAHYSEASDGRNTFILFAEWVESLPVQPAIDKTKFYAALSGRLASDMIDIVWQAVMESGAFVDRESLPFKELLNSRDDFIVRKGLWSEFTDSLLAGVQSGAGEREMPSDLSDGLPHLNRNE